MAELPKKDVEKLLKEALALSLQSLHKNSKINKGKSMIMSSSSNKRRPA
jgi:hypothetical protein